MTLKPTFKLNLLVIAAIILISASWEPAKGAGEERIGRVALNIAGLKNSHAAFKTVTIAGLASETRLSNIESTIGNYSLLRLNENGISDVLNNRPQNLKINLPT